MREELIYGVHVVGSLLRFAPEQILEIYLLEDRDDKRILELKQLARQQGIAVHPLSKKQLDAWKIENSQGAAARVRPKPALTEIDLFQRLENRALEKQPSGKRQAPPLLLALDHIQDPHNLGACLRSADAAGVDAVIIPKARSAAITPAVRKAASGAAETVPCIEVVNLARCLEALKQRNIWVIGAAQVQHSVETTGKRPQENNSLYETDLKIPLVFVFGSEGEGLRRLTRECCDLLVHIPMQGQVESLNVSVAAAICLYEAIRQRNVLVEKN